MSSLTSKHDSNDTSTSTYNRNEERLQSSSPGIKVFRESHCNVLTSLLEAEMWFEAYVRSLTYPFECLPVALTSKKHVIYSHTPLGIACRKFTNKLIPIPSPTNSFGIDMLHHANESTKARYISQFTIIKALYHTCPCQLRCNQVKVGLTPLLEIICNPYATTEVTKFLIDADRSQEETQGKNDNANNEIDSMAIGRRDGNMLLPLHHLICQVHRNSTILPEESKTNNLIQYLVDMYPSLTDVGLDSQKNTSYASPLVHLFSQKVGYQKEDQELMPRIAQCAKILLSSNPDLIKTKSVMTACTPLHMALRNGYGNNIQLISLLLKHDPHGYQVTQRNNFGDLPIHVIATIGACKHTWRLVLDHICTIHRNHRSFDPIEQPCPFIWAINKCGCTPLHLSWMKQKSGKVSYPMTNQPRSVHATQREGLYIDSMQAAVDKTLAAVNECPIQQMDINAIVSESLGQIWDILKLILRSVYFGNQDLKDNEADEFKFILHALCKMVGPMLPQPIFNLVFALFKHQANERDEFLRVPLHYACASVSSQLSQVSTLPSKAQGWYELDTASLSLNITSTCIIDQLLSIEQTASIADMNGYFPLHFAIQQTANCTHVIREQIENYTRWCQERKLGHCVVEWSSIVKKVAEAYPDVLGVPVPKVALYPFMIAAANQMEESVEIVYYLLKMLPTNNFI